MSLINDALRRANQQKHVQPQQPTDGAPMQPAQPVRATNSVLAPMLLIFLLGVVVTCAGWFFWKAFSASDSVSTTEETTAPLAPKPVSSPDSASLTEVRAERVPVSTPTTIQHDSSSVEASDRARVENPVASIPTETNVAPPGPPPPKPLRLQGIFFRISNPTALINGKTVAIGEKVDGARVTTIERQDVTLERDGETIVLTLD